MSIWTPMDGRELDASPLENRAKPARVVACLNVWNDLPALKQSVPTWINFVDAVIAVDGAYREKVLSTDGTRDYLHSLRKVQVIDAAGVPQIEKRTLYLKAGQSGDFLFIVDADETVAMPQNLRLLPNCDVGWVTISSPIYTRPYGQPRIIRWMPELHYKSRHHWTWCGEQLMCTHQYGGVGFSHRPVNLTLHNQRRALRTADRFATKHEHGQLQYREERVMVAVPPFTTASDTKVERREPLFIVHHAYRDDGLAPSRLHTAINRTTPHSSLFFKRRPGPFGVPGQYLAHENSAKLSMALSQCDVVHFHGMMSAVNQHARTHANLVFHHHGTLFRNNAVEYTKIAKARRALVLLSNLELFSWTQGEPAHFLPNAMPVARYRALAQQWHVPFDGTNKFRIAHSPSHPHRKGTDKLEAVVAHLQSKGYPLELVMLHGKAHTEVLQQKATCHAAFDSFWLGMQCSGLEAAAMHLPVLGGDETVAERYRNLLEHVPYTFVKDAGQLETTLMRLVDDKPFYEQERDRVYAHAVTYHDESAVALRYLDLLDLAFGWRSSPRRAPKHVHRPIATRARR